MASITARNGSSTPPAEVAEESFWKQLMTIRHIFQASPVFKTLLAISAGSFFVVVFTALGQIVLNQWNQPFYGFEGEGWFAAFRCFTKYVQLQFFRGTSLDPVPPKSSKHPEVRYFDIHEDDELDERQLTSWFEQASKLPGEKM